MFNRPIISYSLIVFAIIFNLLLVLFLVSSFSASEYSVSPPQVTDSAYISPNYIDDLFHTDALTQYHFFMGLEKGTKLKDWKISTVNHYFPIIPMFGIFYFTFKNPGLSLLMFILTQLGVILFLFSWLARQLVPRFGTEVGIVGVIMLGLFCLYPLYIPDVFINANLLMPYHSGMFVSFLLSLIFFIKIFSGRTQIINYVILLLSIILATISNPLYHAYFTAPTLALMALLSIRNFKKYARIIAIVVGSVVLGRLLLIILPDLTYSLRFSQNHSESYEIMKLSLINMYNQSLYTKIILILTSASFAYSMVFSTITIFKQKLFQRTASSISVYEAFQLIALAMLISAITAPIYAGVFYDPSAIRYILYLMLFGIFNCAVIIGHYSVQSDGKLIRILAVILVAGASLFIIHRCTVQNPFSAFYRMEKYTSTLAVAVDQLKEKYPIKNGVGDFWDAKQATVFSKKKIKLLHVYKELGPHPISICKTEFRSDSSGRPAYFNFVILRNWGDTTSLCKIFGDSIVRVNERGIRFYLVPEFTYNENYEPQLTGKFDFSKELKEQNLKDSITMHSHRIY